MHFEHLKNILSFQAKSADFYPVFAVGDRIKVHCLITDVKKQRVQVFEGLVIAITGSLSTKAFLVRKTSGNFATEKKFFYNSPLLQKVELVEKGKVRRAKIYYIRHLKGKAARIKRASIGSKEKKNAS